MSNQRFNSIMFPLGGGGDPSPHDEVLQLVTEEPVQHGLEAFQLWKPKKVPFQMVVQAGAGLEINPQPNGYFCRGGEKK